MLVDSDCRFFVVCVLINLLFGEKFQFTILVLCWMGQSLIPVAIGESLLPSRLAKVSLQEIVLFIIVL